MRGRRVRNRGIATAGVNLLEGMKIAAPKGVLRKVGEKLRRRGDPAPKANRAKVIAVPRQSRGLAATIALVRHVLRNVMQTKLRPAR